MVPVAETSWVMSRRTALSVWTVIPGGFPPEKICNAVNSSTNPATAIQTIFFFPVFRFPLVMYILLRRASSPNTIHPRALFQKIGLEPGPGIPGPGIRGSLLFVFVSAASENEVVDDQRQAGQKQHQAQGEFVAQFGPDDVVE